MTKQLLELFFSRTSFDDYPEFNITIIGITSDGEEETLIESKIKNKKTKKKSSKKKRRKRKKSKKDEEIDLDDVITIKEKEIDLSKIKYGKFKGTYTMKDLKEIINLISNDDPGVYLGGKSKRDLVDLTLEFIQKWEKNDEFVDKNDENTSK